MSALKITQNQPTIAQESPHYNFITIRRRKYFPSIPSNVIAAPSDPKSYSRRTDRRTLWHAPRGKNKETHFRRYYRYHLYFKTLSQRYRYVIVDFNNRHGPSLLTRPIYASGQCLADWVAVDCGLGSAVFAARQHSLLCRALY